MSYGTEPSDELKEKAKKYDRLSKLFQTLANPTRLQILELLNEEKGERQE